jgi:hypothetical protein
MMELYFLIYFHLPYTSPPTQTHFTSSITGQSEKNDLYLQIIHQVTVIVKKINNPLGSKCRYI